MKYKLKPAEIEVYRISEVLPEWVLSFIEKNGGYVTRQKETGKLIQIKTGGNDILFNHFEYWVFVKISKFEEEKTYLLQRSKFEQYFEEVE